MGVIRSFMETTCGKGGKQKSNLTAAEARGLKSLMTRVEDGEIVVLPTDKTGKFAVMKREEYEKAGLVHSEGDREVNWEEIKNSQREINGHVAMLIKIFNIGKNWDHVERVRETMMGETMGVCPIQLLFKDHKNWKPDQGTAPPTRQVAGGHVGLGLHLSEIISDVVEPMVGLMKRGREVISTEDLLAKIEKLNKSMSDWTPLSWWEGKARNGYISCGTCVGKTDYNFDENNVSVTFK